MGAAVSVVPAITATFVAISSGDAPAAGGPLRWPRHACPLRSAPGPGRAGPGPRAEGGAAARALRSRRALCRPGLRDIVHVSLPVVGATVTAGDPCGQVESTKAISDLSGWSPKYFPSQLVRAANTLLKNKMLFGSDYPLIRPERVDQGLPSPRDPRRGQAADNEGERHPRSGAAVRNIRLRGRPRRHAGADRDPGANRTALRERPADFTAPGSSSSLVPCLRPPLARFASPACETTTR